MNDEALNPDAVKPDAVNPDTVNPDTSLDLASAPPASLDSEGPGAIGEMTPKSAMADWKRLMALKAAAEDEYEAQIASFKEVLAAKTDPIGAQLNEIEKWFVSHSEQVGAEAFESGSGKVTITVRENPKIADPDAFFAWAASTNNVGLLQKRLSVTEFRAYQKDHPEEEMPGVAIEIGRSAKFKPS